MAYFVTGATEFIGRHLVRELVERKQEIHCVVDRASLERLEEMAKEIGAEPGRIVPVLGDLDAPNLGLADAHVTRLRGEVDHFFHLARLSALTAGSEELSRTNVGGTRNAVQLAVELDARCFHHLSTVEASGRYEGIFTEAMFDEAEALMEPHASTAHDAEAIVRAQCSVPFRIYRPGVVIGHSRSGEVDRVDGIYYIFPLIRRLRESLPDWLPRVGIDAGLLNVVPVDFVARALDHIAHAKDLDGRTFHLVDPRPEAASEIVDELCRAAGAPPFSTYVKLPRVPDAVARLLGASERLGPVRRASDALLAEVGVPRQLLSRLEQTTEYSCEETLNALAGSGIEVPPFESYARQVWSFWEAHLAAVASRHPRLAREVEGLTTLVAGADGVLEGEVALRLGAAGAHVLLGGADRRRLLELRHRIVAAGGSAGVLEGDPATRQGVGSLLEKERERGVAVDLLICGSQCVAAAAGSHGGGEIASFEDAIAARFLAPLGLILGVVPGMRKQGKGHVVLIHTVSIDGAAEPALAAATAALEGAASALAREFAPEGVAFTSVHLPPLREEGTATLGTVPLVRAADVVRDALIHKPRRAGTLLGSTSELARVAAPQAYDRLASLLSRRPT